LILLAPVVIKLSHLNLGYVAMIVTKSSMKNVFQITIQSTFLFLKMVMNSSVTSVTKCNLPRAVGPAIKKNRRKKVITMNMMMMTMMIYTNYLALYINASKKRCSNF
jgi:hypothetical protein